MIVLVAIGTTRANCPNALFLDNLYKGQDVLPFEARAENPAQHAVYSLAVCALLCLLESEIAARAQL